MVSKKVEGGFSEVGDVEVGHGSGSMGGGEFSEVVGDERVGW